MTTPAWQVNPKSKHCAPALRAAHKAGTLHLITTTLSTGYCGYSWAPDAASAAEGAAWTRQNFFAHRAGRTITVRPYPYADEVAA